MDGNARVEGSKGVRDPLFCRALAVADDETAALLLSCDLCAVRNDLAARAGKAVSAKTGVPRERVMIAAIHTHAGPAVGLLYPPDCGYEAQLVEAMTQTAAEALSSMRPAEVRVGIGRCETMSHVRRLRMKDGSIAMNWERPDPGQVIGVAGAKDDQILALDFVAPDGEHVATVVNFANHPAILAGDNFLYSRDWPGVLVDGLESRFGGTAMFLNGATGNVNHIDVDDPSQGRGFAEVERLGNMLLEAVVPVVRRARPVEAAPIAGLVRDPKVPRRRVSEDDLRAAKRLLEATDVRMVPLVDGLSDEFYSEELLKLAQMAGEPAVLPLQAIRLGEVALVGVPGEPFAELALETKAKSPFDQTLVIGYANGYQGYIPTRDAFREGGYEVRPTSLSSSLDEGAAEMVVSSLLDMLSLLAGPSSERGKQ